MTFAQVRQMSLAGSRPAAVKTELDNCMARIPASISYDSIGAVPLQPDSVNSNVAGDIVVPNANNVSAVNIGGGITVNRAEMISRLTNFNNPAANSYITARLVNGMTNIYGAMNVEALAMNDLTNIYNVFAGTTHALGKIDGGAAALENVNETRARVCMFAQEVSTIMRTGSGKIVLIGRGEAGDMGDVDSLSQITGSIVTVGLNVGQLTGLVLGATEYIYLESSNSKTIAGDLAGVIYLNASKVDTLSNLGGGQVTVYLMNGAAVAKTAGGVKIVQQ
jgi:hypothetical protein